MKGSFGGALFQERGLKKRLFIFFRQISTGFDFANDLTVLLACTLAYWGRYNTYLPQGMKGSFGGALFQERGLKNRLFTFFRQISTVFDFANGLTVLLVGIPAYRGGGVDITHIYLRV